MSWLLFAFSGPILWAISTHLDKYLVERFFKQSDVAVLLLFTAFAGVLLLPFIWLHQPAVVSLDAESIALIATSGVLNMGAMLFYLRALQSEEPSVVAPFFQTAPLFGYVLAYLVLGETLSALQMAGGALIVMGALTVSVRFAPSLPSPASGGGQINKPSPVCAGGKINKPSPACAEGEINKPSPASAGGKGGGFKVRLAMLMLACGFALALSGLIFKIFAIAVEFWTTTFWMFVGEAIFGVGLLMIASYRRQFIAVLRANTAALLTINGSNELINLGGGLGNRYALLFAPLSIVQAIASTTTLFVFAFGVALSIFCPGLARETLSGRELTQKAIAAALVALGVALVTR